jgi:predicted ester cyclase
MTRDEIAAIFDRRCADYDRRDAAALAGDYTPDCVIESPSAGVHCGRTAAEKVLRRVFDALDVRLHQQSVIIDGHFVAQVLIIEGKDVGEFLGVSPTGKPFRVPGVFLYELKDGLIARERRIYDFAALLIQTGVLKARPAH